VGFCFWHFLEVKSTQGKAQYRRVNGAGMKLFAQVECKDRETPLHRQALKLVIRKATRGTGWTIAVTGCRSCVENVMHRCKTLALARPNSVRMAQGPAQAPSLTLTDDLCDVR